MLYSRAFIPTQRQAPSDAEVISHKLLTRAGMIRKVAMGIYDFLPLGLKSLAKIAAIVRSEMNRAGAQEILMPCVIPAEWWRESGRWKKYGPELLRITDRHDHEYCFGPTHEEVVCEMVRGQAKSWRDYPLNLYQIQTKFRDERRPRFGIMRGREFLMKDAYSFHVSEADLDREYRAMHVAYSRIFERCGLASRAVDADTGAIGGSASHEFMVTADTGEDAIAACDKCDYAANLDKAANANAAHAAQDSSPLKEIHTPGQKSIAEVATFLKIKEGRLIKTLCYRVDSSYAIVCLAGDRDINDVKLKNALGAGEVRLASEAEILHETDAPAGYLGPIGLKPGLKIHFDKSLSGLTGAAAGANRKDYHFSGVSVARELKPTGFIDAASVLPDDRCPTCKDGILKILRGIEVGHIFKLGKIYSEPMKVTFLDEHGHEQCAIMGCYGIGVSRIIAACVEQNHDDAGITWPRALAPYEVVLLTMGPEEHLKAAARELYDSLTLTGLDVLWDDRDERAGVKFNDADLIGLPLQIIIGRKGMEKGEFEYKVRKTGARGTINIKDAATSITTLLREIP